MEAHKIQSTQNDLEKEKNKDGGNILLHFRLY